MKFDKFFLKKILSTIASTYTSYISSFNNKIKFYMFENFYSIGYSSKISIIDAMNDF